MLIMKILLRLDLKDEVMTKPKKALEKNNLAPVSLDGGSIAKGHNDVHTYTAIVNSVPRNGFLKRVIKDGYTAQRAKYTVLSSILSRLALGNVIPEERLVIEQVITETPLMDPSGFMNVQLESGHATKYHILGTFSFELPEFQHFCFSNDEEPSNPELKKLLIPNLVTLIEKNFARIMVNRHYRECDDFHPGNGGVSKQDGVYEYVSIDLDRFLSQGSARNASGYFLETPRDEYELNSDFFSNFPNDTGLFYFPPNPKASVFKPENKFPSSDEMARLSGNAAFHRQMMSQSLLELLMHKPAVIQQHLEDHLGENDPFIEDALHMVERKYNAYYRAVVFYKGCDRNAYDQFVPSFANFLHATPSAFKEALSHVRAYNERMSSEHTVVLKHYLAAKNMSLDSYLSIHGLSKKHCLSEYGNCEDTFLAQHTITPDEYLIDEQDLQQHYHQIWRDSHIHILNDINLRLEGIMKAIKNNLDPLNTLQGELLIRSELIETKQATEAHQLLENFTIIDAEDFRELGEHALAQAWFKISAFKEQFDACVKPYYALKHHELTAEANQIFTRELYALSTDHEIHKLLGNETPMQVSFNELLGTLLGLTTKMSWPRHLNADDKNFEKPSLKSTTKVPVFSYEQTSSLHAMLEHVFAWVDVLESDDFKQKISHIIDTKYSSLFALNRARGTTVKALVDSSKEANSHILRSILARGGIENTSLNTKIMESLVGDMLTIASNVSFDHCWSVTKDAYDRNDAQLKWTLFAEEAQQMCQVAPETTFSIVSRKLFDWVNTIDRQTFKSRLEEYVFASYSTWGSMFSMGDRKSSIMKLLSDPNYDNARILATIFNGNLTSTSLAPKAMDYFMQQIIIQAKIETVNHPDDEDWQRIARLDLNIWTDFRERLVEHSKQKLASYISTALVGRDAANVAFS